MMDESTYLYLFLIIIVLLIVVAALAFLTYSNQATSSGSAAYGVNKNISKIAPAAANIINATLTPLANTLAVNANSIEPNINNATANIIKIVSNNTAAIGGVNKNISTVSTQDTQIIAGQGSASTRASSQTQIELNNTNTLENITKRLKNISYELNTLTGVGWLSIWTINQSAPAGNALEAQMLDTFANKINVTASNAINITVLTTAQFINYSVGNSYTKTDVYTSSGSDNAIGFYFNTSEGCSAYLYIIRASNTMQGFTLYPNISAKYEPTATLTGVCK